jgi:hypothetical protein
LEKSISRAATYGETDEERGNLRTSVVERGWSCSGREYGPGEWDEMLSDASKGRFDVICASFDGLRWFAPVTREVEYERLLPKRATPSGPPKGSVIGGRPAVEEFAGRLISERGAQSLDDITGALVQSGLGVGSAGSVRNIVLFALRASDRFADRYDKDHGKRWRLKPAKPSAELTAAVMANAPQSPAATTYALARIIAEELVRELTSRPPEELTALLRIHENRERTD